MRAWPHRLLRLPFTPLAWLRRRSLLNPLAVLLVLAAFAHFGPRPFPTAVVWAGWAGGAVLILLPRLQVLALSDPAERVQNEIAARQSLLQLVAPAVLLVGAYLAWGQLQIASNQLEDQRSARATDRFARAVDQLNSQHHAARVGGVYALERISKESPELRWTIQEMLTTFIRERAPRKRSLDSVAARPFVKRIPDFPQPDQPAPPQDVQAALFVLGRNDWGRRTEEVYRGVRRFWLNLSHTDLRGADLVRFGMGSDLRVDLQEADLERAVLTSANLAGAWAQSADLAGANLFRADLSHANLAYANLQQAELAGAALIGAQLGGADLSHAHIYPDQLKEAELGGMTILPDGSSPSSTSSPSPRMSPPAK